MSEFKGTPGPWMIKKEYDSWSIRKKGSTKRHSSGFQTYREVCEEVGSKFDAKLIAAAPDLLQALNGLLFAYEDPGNSGSTHDDKVLAARTAIAKATA